MNAVTLPLLGVLLLFGCLVRGSKCPEQESITRHVLCYYKGRASLDNIDLCNCTHIILADAVAVTDDYALAVSEDAKSHLEIIREKKESLIKMFTLEAKGNLKESIFESENKTRELIDGITDFVYESEFDGIELYFPLTAKDNVSKESVMDFVKVLKKNLENESHLRVKRGGGYDVFEKVQDDVTTASYRAQTAEATRKSEKSINKLSAKRRKTQRSPRDEKDNPDDERTAGEESTVGKRLQSRGEEVRHQNGHGAGSADSKTLLFVRLPVNPEVIAKKFDLKFLSKYANLLVISTHNLTDESETNLTYHPSRLMGLSDMLNADSILDFLTGLSVPKSKIVLTIPATVLKFQLEDGNKTTPRSPTAGELQVIDQTQLCHLFGQGNWVVERDEDLTAPYAFSNKTWLAYEDKLSVQIKAKYIILRELAGGAIYPIDADTSRDSCNDSSTETDTLTNTLYYNMKNLGRKPRALVLDSLQQDIHETSFSNLQGGVRLSEYRIVRVVDHSGAVHVIRKNTKTEFQCSRQGYFSHPLGCNKFYRCVKFNQYTDDFTVFEYDCPAGLAFDERWEVCVWPGSLPHGAPCTGSSEIAPVPRSHYECPNEEGYYADPENCRWFFACLDHARDGITPLTAYEFRCPFGLVFNERILACDWPWNVGSCGNRGLPGVVLEHHGGSHSVFQSATYVRGGSPDSDFPGIVQGNSLGKSPGSVIGSDAVYLSQSEPVGNSQNAYIASHFDDNQQRPSFGTLPEYEISGGRILNAGGFVLNQQSNAQIDSVSAAKLHFINEQSNDYSNRFGFPHSSGGGQESSHLHKGLGIAAIQTTPSATQPPLTSTVSTLSQLVYSPALPTPKPFSVAVPGVQINQEPIADYSPSRVSSSTAASVESAYVHGGRPLIGGSPAPSLNAALGRRVNEVFAADVNSHFHEKTFDAHGLPNEHAGRENLDNIYVTTAVPVATRLRAEGVNFASRNRNDAVPKGKTSSVAAAANYGHHASDAFSGNTGGETYSVGDSNLEFLSKAHQINDVFGGFRVSTATPSSGIYVHREYASNGVLTGHAKEQSTNRVFLNSQPEFHSFHQSNVIHAGTGNGFSAGSESSQTQFEVPAAELRETRTELPKTSYGYQTSVDSASTYQVHEHDVKNAGFAPTVPAHGSPPVEHSRLDINGKSLSGNNGEFQSGYVYAKPVSALGVESPKTFPPRISQVREQSNYVANSDRNAFQSTSPDTFVTATPFPLRKEDPKPVVFASTAKPTFFETLVKVTPVPASISHEKSYFAPGRVSSPAPFSLRKETPLQSAPASPFRGPEYLPPAEGVSKEESDLTITTPEINQNDFAKQTFVTTFAPQIFKPSQYPTPVTGVLLEQSDRGEISKANAFESKFVQHPTAATFTPDLYKTPEYLSPAGGALTGQEQPEVVAVTKLSIHHQQTVVTSPSPEAFKASEYLPPTGQVESKQAAAELTILKPVHQQHVSYHPTQKTAFFQSITSENQNIRDEHEQTISQPAVEAVDLSGRYDQSLNVVPSSTPGPVAVTYEERQVAKAVSPPRIIQQKDAFFGAEDPKQHFQSFAQHHPSPAIYKQKSIESAYNFGASTGTPKSPVVYSKPSVQVTTPSSYADFGLKSIPFGTGQVSPYQQSTVSSLFESAGTPGQRLVEHKQISSSPSPEVYQVNTFVAHSTSEPSPIIQASVAKQDSLTVRTEEEGSGQQPYLFQQQIAVSSPRPEEERNGNYISPLGVDKSSQTIFFKQPIVVPENPKGNVLQQILLQPETNAQQATQSEDGNPTLSFVTNKKPKTIYFENYTRAKPLSSVLAQEIVQPEVHRQTYVTSESPAAVTNLISAKEYHSRDDEDASTYGNFEFEKIGAVKALSGVSQLNAASPSGAEIQSGPYSSPEQYVKSLSFDNAQVKYEVNSNIQIAPPPREYLLAATPNLHSTTTTATPELSSPTPQVYKTWNRPTAPTEEFVHSAGIETDDGDYNHQPRRHKNGKVTVFSVGELDKEELDEENVESLLKKYSGDYGNVLVGGRNKFVTKIVQGEGRGQIPVGNEKEKSSVGYKVSSSGSKNRGYVKSHHESEQEVNGAEEDSVATLDLKNLKIKKNKKTVIVVSQVSESNPLLIGKLAGQCSCQSNKIQIRGGGRRPSDLRAHSNANAEAEGGDEVSGSIVGDSLAIEAVTPVSSTVRVATENVVLIDGSRATGKLHLAESSFSTTESADPFKSGRVLFRSEEPRARRPTAKGKPRLRAKYGGEVSSNDLGSPLFTPIAAHEIASTVDYASVGSRDRSESKSSGVISGAAYDRYGPGGLRGYDETLQGSIDCERPGLFRHPKHCNKFYACNYDPWKKRYILHVFNCPIHLSYDSSISACNWPSKGPACADDNLLL